MAGVIVYYVVSVVHVRNVQAVAAALGDWTLRVVYERDNPWLHAGNMRDIGLETVVFDAGSMPADLWAGQVRAVVFSTVQPRPGPVALLRDALDRGVATIAVEETNQVALNQGRVNNYVLPVDRVFASSAHERRAMIDAGFPERRFEVTGWPFYHGQAGPTAPERQRACKADLGLDPERPLAALTLTGLHDAGESPEVRRRQLAMAAQGLPADFQLAVKPHPKEPLKTLVPFVEECAPEAKVVDGVVPINALLDAADILLNRGVSQVCIEALFQEIPVIVIETGISTPFHGVADDLIAGDQGQLRAIVERVRGSADWLDIYRPFFAEHIPHGPVEARALTCQRIAEVAGGGASGTERGEQLFELAFFQAWVGDSAGAARTLAAPEVAAGYPAAELGRLAAHSAGRRDLAVLQDYIGKGFRAHFLRCLWVDQCVAARIEPDEGDIAWMEGFPPPMWPDWFIPRARAWFLHLAGRGQRPAAAEFAARVCREYPDTTGVERLRRDADTYFNRAFGRARVALRDQAVQFLRPVRDRLLTLTR